MRTNVRIGAAQNRAFTLVEMLAVMAIITILMVLVAPAMVGLTMGNAVSRAGTVIEDNLNIARQRCLATQREVDVRFFSCTDPEDAAAAPAYRALQLFEVNSNSGLKVPISPVIFLQHTMIMMTTTGYSSFLDGGVLSPTETQNVTTPTIPGVTAAYSYREFGFRPAGDTNLLDKTQTHFITVASARDIKPKNFFTITIDPLTTKVVSYRP